MTSQELEEVDAAVIIKALGDPIADSSSVLLARLLTIIS
jgi:hypothetical protein